MVRKIAGGLLIAAGVVLGLYVGIGIVLVDGVGNVVDGAKENPTDVWQIVWGVLEVTPLAEVVGGLIFWVFTVAGGYLLGTKGRKRRSKLSK